MCISCWEYQTKGLAAAAEYEEQPWQAFVTAKLVNFDIGLRQKSCRVLKQKQMLHFLDRKCQSKVAEIPVFDKS